MIGLEQKKGLFSKTILSWHKTRHRPLPWKGEKDPYLIWLSEIILQQTRVEQGMPYFEKIKSKYPTIEDLASAPEDEVMKLWEGLGYYSRARNLHAAAKFIASELGGIFPNKYEGIRALKGVGGYTAAAIASFAFGLPHAVVDGNVYRVLSRFFGIAEPVDTAAGKKLFAGLAQELLDEKQPGRYNQAIMDFGASQCVPASPGCTACPLWKQCLAFEKGMVGSLPVKSKRLERKTRFFNYLVIRKENSVFITKRREKDIWHGLFDFPLIELGNLPGSWEEFLREGNLGAVFNGQEFELFHVTDAFTQILTHQKINAIFWMFQASRDFKTPDSQWEMCPINNIKMHAFPKIIGHFFQENYLPLEPEP